jgi:hypothetical protein
VPQSGEEIRSAINFSLLLQNRERGFIHTNN